MSICLFELADRIGKEKISLSFFLSSYEYFPNPSSAYPIEKKCIRQFGFLKKEKHLHN